MIVCTPGVPTGYPCTRRRVGIPHFAYSCSPGTSGNLVTRGTRVPGVPGYPVYIPGSLSGSSTAISDVIPYSLRVTLTPHRGAKCCSNLNYNCTRTIKRQEFQGTREGKQTYPGRVAGNGSSLSASSWRAVTQSGEKIHLYPGYYYGTTVSSRLRPAECPHTGLTDGLGANCLVTWQTTHRSHSWPPGLRLGQPEPHWQARARASSCPMARALAPA
eukprot:2664327-Rhodomonas_salina.3